MLAVSLYSDLQRLVTVCADRTLVMWDIRQPQERAIGVIRSFVSHAGCIWDVLAVERRREEQGGIGEEEKMTERERQRDEQRRDSKLLVPDQSLITCAADNSLRLWHLSREAVAQAKQNRNDKSKWSDQQIHCMHTPDGSVKCMLSLASYPHQPSLAARADLLVTGDTAGVVRVWSLSTLQQVAVCSVSDKEVKCMEYDAVRDTLIAGCRDGHIHTVDLSTLQDLKATTLPSPHSAAVTALAVTSKGLLLSISTDKSIVFRAFSPTTNTYTLQSTTIFKTGTPHHLVLHPTDKYAAVCTSDRYIRLFDLATQKESRQYRLAASTEAAGSTAAEPLRLALDGTGRMLAVCCSDRSVSVVEWFSGAVMCVLNGHGSVLTAVRWVAGGGRLVTVSADGCVFVWTVDEKWARLIRDQSKRIKRSSGPTAGAGSIAGALDSARSVGGGMLSARRRRSALEYLDDDDGEAGRGHRPAGGSVSEMDATNASELDLLDEEDKPEVRSPKVQPRPAAVPPLALPSLADERKEVAAAAHVEVKKAVEEKEATTIDEQPVSRDRNPLAANVPDWARTGADQVPAQASTPPSRSTRWSMRAQSGYKMVSELDSDGVEVTPRVPRRVDREVKGQDEDEEGLDEVEEEAGLRGMQEEKEAMKPNVVREQEAEIEEDITPTPALPQAVTSITPAKRNSSPTSPAAVIGRPSVTPPATFSPALPPRPMRDGNSPTPPPLSNSTAPSTPPQPPPRRSLPSSRSSSRNASPTTKPRHLEVLSLLGDGAGEPRSGGLLSPISPMRALPAIPLQLPASPQSSQSSQAPVTGPVSPSLSQSLQSLQLQLTQTLSLFSQHKANPASSSSSPSSASSHSHFEQQLFGMHQQLAATLTEQRIDQLRQSANIIKHSDSTSTVSSSTEHGAGVEEFERSLSSSSGIIAGGVVGGGGTGMVGATLDRYSDLLLDLVMKKLEMRNTREL